MSMKNPKWVGVDCHKDTLACYQENNKDKTFKELKNTLEGFKSALKWAGPDAQWAIEGAYCFGRPFSLGLYQ